MATAAATFASRSSIRPQQQSLYLADLIIDRTRPGSTVNDQGKAGIKIAVPFLDSLAKVNCFWTRADNLCNQLNSFALRRDVKVFGPWSSSLNLSLLVEDSEVVEVSMILVSRPV